MTADAQLRQRLRQLFHAELEEAVVVLNAGLVRLEEAETAAEAADLVTELFRTAHSVKGAAMSAGVEAAVGAARRLEGGFASLRGEPQALHPDMIPGFLAEVDALVGVLGQLGGEPGAHEGPVRAMPEPAPGETPTTRREGHNVRVAAGAVDELVGHAGELAAAAGQTDVLARALATEGERRDPGTTGGVTQAVERLRRDAAGLARDVARVSAAITAGVERLTLQPFADACSGLERTVRDVAHAGGKRARLVVEGADVEVDRAVAAMLREPLGHLVRNAVDHGIETPDRRSAAGKPQTGTVTVTAGLRQGRLEVVTRDDGRGVDRDALRRAAGDSGPGLSGDELALAFAPGVSTATAVTDVSGRGVGLDAVRARVEAVGGAVRMVSTPGEGTAVTLTSPVNLALMRVLLLEVAGETVALPTAAIERLVTVSAAEVQRISGRMVVTARERTWPVRSLAGLFGEPSASGQQLRLALVEVGSSAAALAADAFLDEQEVVVKPLPDRLAGIAALLGVTILAERGATLVLNPGACVREDATRLTAQAAYPASEEPGPRHVLVVEDTATTRVLQQHILEGAGYAVTTAADGVEAWEALERHGADVVVSDVHMPRMDGVELCRAVRRSERLAGLPVVLVTSLGSEEDRRRGVEAGADAYLVKAEFEADLLLETLERLL